MRKEIMNAETVTRLINWLKVEQVGQWEGSNGWICDYTYDCLPWKRYPEFILSIKRGHDFLFGSVGPILQINLWLEGNRERDIAVAILIPGKEREGKEAQIQIYQDNVLNELLTLIGEL